MRWPDDGRPCFIVQTVTGYRIDPHSLGYVASHAPPTCAAVLDRAFCDRIVREFVPGGKMGRSSECIGRAERLAAVLNLCEAEGDGEGQP